jgi:hypothetical protein
MERKSCGAARLDGGEGRMTEVAVHAMVDSAARNEKRILL